MDFIAAQNPGNEPEAFQGTLIASISQALLQEAPPPCLLRAPTGSGKTFVMAKLIERVCASSPTFWLWFVPFSNLVQQTEDTIAANATALIPISLDRGRNQDPASGMVVLSTAQAVARAKSRVSGYKDGVDDLQRSLSSLIALARARGLQIGMVVDEAHIGLDSQTEFGQFARWVHPDRLLMASATPKDQRLDDFIRQAGYSAHRTFVASRDEVVLARLNKRYIEAVVYDLRQSMQTITDLRQTVLLQAWKRNQRLHKLLNQLGIPINPLLLVQVGNGEEAISEARECLMRVCKVDPGAIGEHSSDAPNPALMASIANDPTKDVLIFKQSAGTGFDAPRAFVLASTKPVNDPDFAMQFIGRVMRVHRLIRSHYPRTVAVPAEINTAYVYLANAQAQQGFEQAVAASSSMKSELEGQTEVLIARQMASGAVHYSNRSTDEPPLFFDSPLPLDHAAGTLSGTTPLPLYRPGDAGLLFADDGPSDGIALDLPVLGVRPKKSKPLSAPASREDLLARLTVMDIRAFALKRTMRNLPIALKAEDRPIMQNMAMASTNAAARLEISPALQKMALNVALGRVTEQEVHTELTTATVKTREVAVVIERSALAKEARKALDGLPQVEEDDQALIINVLTNRMGAYLVEELAHIDEDERPDAAAMKRMARDGAYWIIRKSSELLGELLHAEIATQAQTVDAAPLPDYMIFPSGLALEPSSKNIYGVLPPSRHDMERLTFSVPIDTRDMLRSHTKELSINGELLRLAEFDGSHTLGDEERAFAKALDRASFVHWWHRNPDRKSYSTRLARGEHKNYFYPDFVVCVEHFNDDELLMRLVETKESTKDAARKSQHASPLYGRVLFLTKDQKTLRWIEEDGSLGGTVDLDDLDAMREWLRRSRPSRGASAVGG